MSLVTADHVQELIRNSLIGLTNTITTKINHLEQQINQAVPPPIEEFQPVVIDPNIESGNASLDLIKSVPEFNGDIETYPGWRAAALFAMNYYPENSEKFYVATGILRNKIVSGANTTLSAFNTVLNFKAIIDRLDKSFADKPPLHVLENELSILRQNNSSLTDFYDKVDRQLNLIINKQIMSFNGQYALVSALNERARDNALRVFISDLRRPLCDILFSARPKDLPSALVTAQELETNHRRNDFAKVHDAGISLFRATNQHKPHPTGNPIFRNFNQSKFYPTTNPNRPIPMDVDSSRIVRHNHLSKFQVRNNNPFQVNNFPNRNYQNNANAQFPRNNHAPNTGAIPKRPREDPITDRTRLYKQQRINYMPDSNSEVKEGSESEYYQSEDDELIDDISNNEINFLG